MILRSAAARAKAGRNFSEMPSQISSTPISTRPVANCPETNSRGSLTRTASGTFSGAKPSLVGSASRRTARRLNSIVAATDPDGGTGALRSGEPMAPTEALGRRGNPDPETTIGAGGGPAWVGKGSTTAKAGNGAATAAKGLGTDGGRAAGGATGTPEPAKPPALWLEQLWEQKQIPQVPMAGQAGPPRQTALASIQRKVPQPAFEETTQVTARKARGRKARGQQRERPPPGMRPPRQARGCLQWPPE